MCLGYSLDTHRLDLGLFQGKKTSQCLGWSSSPTDEISPTLDNSNVELPKGLRKLSPVPSYPQGHFNSLLSPKLHPWSSLLSLGTDSSAVTFLLKARNLQLIHLHVSPQTCVCVWLCILTLWLQPGLLCYLETSSAAFPHRILFLLPYFPILKSIPIFPSSVQNISGQ